MDYYDYLMSVEWQKKRTERLRIDNFECQKCGRPMDLQVHHLNYDRIGNENVYTDLITLCKYCHKKIEDQKSEYKENQKSAYRESITTYSNYREDWKADRRLELHFCREYEDQDYSKGGRLNLTNREVIKAEWEKWPLKKRMKDPDLRVTTIINYFRTLRIRLIISMQDAGASPDEIMARGISRNMVYKYFSNRELAEKVIQYGLKEMEEYS